MHAMELHQQPLTIHFSCVSPYIKKKEYPMCSTPRGGSRAQGLNVALYWKNTDPRKYVNVVPTSGITGAGALPAVPAVTLPHGPP